MGWSHVLPLQACLTITIIYGFFMVGAGAEFVGPLGISIVWAIYHAISPWLLVLYVFFPFKHEVRHKKVRIALAGAAVARPRTCSLGQAWRCCSWGVVSHLPPIVASSQPCCKQGFAGPKYSPSGPAVTLIPGVHCCWAAPESAIELQYRMQLYGTAHLQYP